MTKEEILYKLKIYDDLHFKFDEKNHIYTYKNKKLTSVTTFIQQFHKEFEIDKWSAIIAERESVPQQEILNRWDKLKTDSQDLGRDLHEYIEYYFKQLYHPLPNNIELIKRINKFNLIFAKKLHELIPVTFEQKIFSTKLKIAGTMDGVFLNEKDNEILLLDYKTNKKYTTDETNRFQTLLPPFENYWENDQNKYSIQLSLYAYILEEIGISIKSMYLIHIPTEGDAKIHKAHDLRDVLKEYFNRQVVTN